MRQDPESETARGNFHGLSAFSNINTFEDAQRMAKALSMSSLVPKAYQNNVPNTMVALEMAARIGISPIFVMQNLDIIQGKPSWNSTFIIAALNSCGRFEPLKFEFSGTKGTDDYGCTAYTKDKDGNTVRGTKITHGMVVAEGWLSKAGSKWKTMPEQMFQYRAASFFGRVHAPDILNGMHSVDEVRDFIQEIDPEIQLQEIQDLYFEKHDSVHEDVKIHIDRVIKEKEISSYPKVLKTLQQI